MPEVDGCLPPEPALARLARVFWPPRCLRCEASGVHGLDLCPPCLAELPRNTRVWPPPPPPLDAVHAPFLYAPPLDQLLPGLKFHADLAAGRLLAQLMAMALADATRPDALVPVPLHPARLRRRGYDQARELALPLARALRLPLRTDLLKRTRATAPQSELHAAARRRNVRDAFAVVARDLPAHVALVDDVMTTGATLAAAAAALKRAGVERVEAWTCARVP